MFANIPFPSFFICFLIFILWMHYEKRKADKKGKRESQEFWQREEEANHARNRDFSDLSMFCPDASRIPMPETEDENVTYYQKRVTDCLELPMMNLSQFTNTDLKLAYGVGNFKTLSNYDENFNDFLMNMSNLGKAYFTAGLLQESESIYRFCIESGSKKSNDYKALAEVYSAMGTKGKIDDLITEVGASELPRKASLIEHLRSVR